MSEFTPNTRQSAILDMIRENGFVATEAMVTEFDVTPQTIRRDLNALGAHGLITRFHGGAGQVQSVSDRPYADRLRTGVEAKRVIAEATAALIPNDASLFLITGTTTEAVAEALLGHTNLHVVTNNINVASILMRNETFRVTVTGGEVQNQDGGLVGVVSTEVVRGFRMDVGIIGVSGVDDDGTLLEFDAAEVHTTRAIMENARKVILVADRHKFGRRAMNRLGGLGDVDVVVTDAALPAAYADLCAHSGVRVVVADVDGD